jgi:small subunit ribosomal protein S19
MSRSLYKCFYFDKNLILKKRNIIYNKSFIILPEYVGNIFSIYNGKKLIDIIIYKHMLGKKFGEFIRTRVKHVYVKKKKKKKR